MTWWYSSDGNRVVADPSRNRPSFVVRLRRNVGRLFEGRVCKLAGDPNSSRLETSERIFSCNECRAVAVVEPTELLGSGGYLSPSKNTQYDCYEKTALTNL